MSGPVTIPLPTPFAVGPVNVFLVRDDALTLVDTGTCTPEAEEALRAGLAAEGVVLADLERVILTHHHVDHTGLCARIVAESGAEVWAHPDVEVQARLGHAHDEPARQFFLGILAEFGVPGELSHEAMGLWDAFKGYGEPFTVDRVFTDGAVAGPFRTWFVPGHSSTDTLLAHVSGDYTIAGDHILEIFNPNPLLRRPAPGAARAPALVEYQASLRKSQRLDLGVCHPGHGAAIPDPRRAIAGILAQHERKDARILANLTDAPVTPYTVCRWLYPELPLPSLYLGLSVATGHLELLETRGLVRAEHRDGVVHYQRQG